LRREGAEAVELGGVGKGARGAVEGAWGCRGGSRAVVAYRGRGSGTRGVPQSQGRGRGFAGAVVQHGMSGQPDLATGGAASAGAGLAWGRSCSPRAGSREQRAAPVDPALRRLGRELGARVGMGLGLGWVGGRVDFLDLNALLVNHMQQSIPLFVGCQLSKSHGNLSSS
jgi:hypothetical protein